MIKFVKGDMLRVKVDGLLYTSEGFATGNPGLCDGLLVFEFIDLVTFPSFNDFFGNTTVIKHGDLVTVIKYVGRPNNISRDTSWFKYDVYDIMINGQIRQIFSQNLERVL